MSKIAIIMLDNLNRTPYLENYLEIFANENVDIISWNRSGITERVSNHQLIQMSYKIKQTNNFSNKILKLCGYIRFRIFSNKIIQNNKYDKIIIFATNTAIVLGFKVLHKYRKKYILDIRDYWQEKRKIVYFLVKKIIKNSYRTVISSDGYREFLPQSYYTLVHNFNSNYENNRSDRMVNYSKEVYTLACIGGVKSINYDESVIKIFANDSRFVLRFIGRGYEHLKKYISDNNIINVYAGGEFAIEETFNLYNDVDCVLNLYGYGTPKLDYALSNKLYISASLKKPIIVNKKTFMEKMVTKYRLGFVFDDKSDQSKEDLFDFLNNLDYDSYKNSCDIFIREVKMQNEIFKKEIVKLIES